MEKKEIRGEKQWEQPITQELNCSNVHLVHHPDEGGTRNIGEKTHEKQTDLILGVPKKVVFRHFQHYRNNLEWRFSCNKNNRQRTISE